MKPQPISLELSSAHEPVKLYTEYTIHAARGDWQRAADTLRKAQALSHTTERIAKVLSGQTTKGPGVHEIRNAVERLKVESHALQQHFGPNKIYGN